MTLPLYIMRRWAMPGGNRLRKLLIVESPDIAGICEVCSLNVYKRRVLGVEQLDGTMWGGKVYHRICRPSNAGRVYETNNGHNSRPKPAKGNLGEEEYRYWIGSRENYSCFAMCRACRESVYGPMERVAHFNNAKFTVDGNPCTIRLVNCYKAMDAMTTCLVCKKQRWNHKKWGIPLCDDIQCHTEWKFSQEKWVPLEARLRMQVKRAEALGRGSSIKIDGPDGIRTWCQMCRLFEDNVAHAEIHNARLISGIACGDDC